MLLMLRTHFFLKPCRTTKTRQSFFVWKGRRMGRIDYNNVVGQRFGNLKVISEEKRDPKYGPRFLCQCDCGNQKVILGHSLIKGYSKSCGCRRGCRGDYSGIGGTVYL